jgi:glycosyltransferase involved in cell wall biosynthesis
MARVLLSAYACEPGRGSEPGVGWNWATELAELGHHVTVITRADNRTMIESHFLPPNLTFVYFDLPRWVQRWRAGLRAKAAYYVLWQWFAARHIRRLFPSPPFDVVHHITYVSARYPSFMGSLGIPFWFGPVSGGEAVPRPLRSGFSAKQRFREWLRDVSNSMLRFDPLVRRTFHRASRILVTRDTRPLLPSSCLSKTDVHLAVGLPDAELTSMSRLSTNQSSELRMLYIGRLLEWKGVDIALLAMSQIIKARPDVRFTIIGQGPARSRLENLCSDLHLQAVVHWIGWQPQRTLDEHYSTSNLLLFPSLRDSGGSVVLEALAHGLPVLCTDLGGPGIIVDATCGRVLPTAGRERTILSLDMADAVIEVVSTPNLLKSLSYGARVRARQFKFRDLAEAVYADLLPMKAPQQA